MRPGLRSFFKKGQIGHNVRMLPCPKSETLSCPVLGQYRCNEIGMKHKFEKEVSRLTKFQRNFFGEANFKKQKNIDLRGYAKYLLKEGSVIEKRELLACMKSKLVLTQKILTLQNK